MSSAPADVTTATDATGLARLEVAVPDGDASKPRCPSRRCVARIGDKVRAMVESGGRGARGTGSLLSTAPEGFGRTTWLAVAPGASRAEGGADIDLGGAIPGLHEATLVVPRATGDAEAVGAPSSAP